MPEWPWVEVKIKATDKTGPPIEGLNRKLRDSRKAAEGLGSSFTSTTQRAAGLADGVGRMSTTLARSADTFGLNAQALRTLDDVMDVAELGAGSLTKGMAGLNLASVGVAGAGLAVGTAIGNWLNTFQVVRDGADALTGALYRLGQSQADLDKQTNAMRGLKDFQAKMAASNEEAIRKQVAAMKAQGATVDEVAKFYKGRLSPALAESLGLTEKQIKAGKDYAKVLKDDLAKAAEEAAKQFDALAAAVTDASAAADEAQWDRWEKGLDAAGEELTRLSRAAEESQLDEMAKDAAQAADEARASYEGMAAELGTLDGVAKGVKASLKEAFADLPNVIIGAIQGGGDVGKAIGAHLGASIGQGLADKFGDVLKNTLGDTLGKALGSALPVVGSLLGSLVGKGLSKLGSALGIGGNKVVMQVNDLRDAFFEAQGGFVALQKKLVGLTDQDLVKKIFDAKTVEGFNAAVSEVNALLGSQENAQAALQDAVKRYGFAIEELGPKFRQQELDKQAAGLLKDYELLVASGIDVNTVISKMGPNLVEFVNTARAAGSSVPEAMRPMVEQLIASGQLLDENGNAFKSAEEAGITFAQSLSESMASVVDEIRNLVAALTGIPRNVTTTVTTRHENVYGGAGGAGSQDSDGVPAMARGGVVLPFVPRAANGLVSAQPGGRHVLVGEGGQTELVAPVRALAREIGAAAAAAAGGGGGDQAIVINIDGQVLARAMVRRNRAGALPVAASSVRR